ncbi:MAG TPA: TonB-dependent receptor [Acidobacteriaceae bacterium]
MIKRVRKSFRDIVFLASAFASIAATAQTTGGTISGTISDPTGAVVAGAQVKITDTATAISQILTTNGSGLFDAPNLTPGNYDVLVTMAGFSDTKSQAIVTVGRNIVLNMSLQMAASSTVHVQVNAITPTVDLGSSSLNQTVDGKTVRELPLNGRDWTSLSILEPNVHTVDNQVAISAGDNSRANRGIGTQLTIGGNRPQQNNYRLDGITVNDYSGGGPGGALGLTLGVDAIQEFSVVTSNASAEYGRVSGGVVAAVTRAGGNQFHGSGYEFIRNSALDAKNYFYTGPAPFKRNQFGGSVGGPIFKDHTFFFFDYEGIRQDLSSATSITTPTSAARLGQLHCSPGKSSQICPVVVDPKVVPYFAIYPVPNQPIPAYSDTGTYSYTSAQRTTENFFTGRVDQTFSAKDNLHVTGLSDDSDNSQPDVYNFILNGLVVNRKDFSVTENHVFTPNLVNFARVGFARSVVQAPSTSTAINPLANETSLGFTPTFTVGEIQVPGLTTFLGGVGAEGSYRYAYNSYQVGDDFYWTRGAHSLQFGGSFEQIQSNNLGSLTGGYYIFGGLAQFLTNQPSQFSSAIPGNPGAIYLRQKVYGGYAEDNWRVRKNLTANIGIRYEPTSVVGEKYGHIASLKNITDPAPTTGVPYFQNPTLRDVSPRIGFAWDPFSRGTTSVRAGFGIYDTLPLTYLFNLTTLNSAPYSVNVSLSNAAQLAGTFPKQSYTIASAGTANRVGFVQPNPPRSYVEQFNLNIQQQIAEGTTLEVGYTGAHGVHQPLHANDGNYVQPLNPQDTFNMVWPRFVYNSKTKSYATSGVKINPILGTIDSIKWNEDTNYNALNVALRTNIGSTRFGFSYTWSKSLDLSSSSVGGTNFTNSIINPYLFQSQRFRGLSDFNVANNVVVNGLYTMPTVGSSTLVRKITEGFQLGGIFRFATGLPFTPLVSGDALGLSSNNPLSFPDRIKGPGCSGNPTNINDKANFIKVQCFAFPQPIVLPDGSAHPPYEPRNGNLQRNSIIGPTLTTVDMSLVKSTSVESISQTARVEFRTEVFNLLNHPNFAVPSRTNSAIFNASGQSLTPNVLTTNSTNNRQLQFGLKLIF